MPRARQKRHCACLECDGKRGREDGVYPALWKKHAEEMARGSRPRRHPVGFAEGGQPAAAELLHWPSDRDPAIINNGEGGVLSETLQCAIEAVELVASGKVTVTGADSMLKCLSRRFNPHLQKDAPKIPPSWHLALKMGIDGHEPKFIWRDFCNGTSANRAAHDDYLFPAPPGEKKCPTCRYKTYYIHIEHRMISYVCRMFSYV